MPAYFVESMSVCAVALHAVRATANIADLMHSITVSPNAPTVAGGAQQYGLAMAAGIATVAYAACGGSKTVLIANMAMQVMGALAALLLMRSRSSSTR